MKCISRPFPVTSHGADCPGRPQHYGHPMPSSSWYEFTMTLVGFTRSALVCPTVAIYACSRQIQKSHHVQGDSCYLAQGQNRHKDTGLTSLVPETGCRLVRLVTYRPLDCDIGRVFLCVAMSDV